MFGRAGELERLNSDRNNPELPPFTRLQADKAHAKIVAQMKDKKLMTMRERLINANLAGDVEEVKKIEVAMRTYTRQDQETGR